MTSAKVVFLRVRQLHETLLADTDFNFTKAAFTIWQHSLLLDGEIVSHFWEWTDLSSYLMALTVFTVISSILTAIFIKSAIYIEVLGIAALLTEAVLGLPQLIRNCSRHSTKGMSVSMVLMWTIGDIGKLAYFLILEQPPQFWMCAILQVI
uniref:Transmembrane protein n=1 Tax=Syphacia muris TaxID=451379 RepID=A0A0N5AQX8_9BILA